MILQNIYNKVIGFFRQTDAEQQESTKDTACNRLRVVLMQDRTNLTPELMERMRREMIELLSKYVEMDKEALELNLEQDGEQVALMLSIPVIRAKDEEEIKAALAKEDEEKQKEKSEEDDEEKEDDNDGASDDYDKEKEQDSEDDTEDESSEDETENDNTVENNEKTSETEEEETKESKTDKKDKDK